MSNSTRASSIWITCPIGFSSLIGCSFILEEAINPESAKDLYVMPVHRQYPNRHVRDCRQFDWLMTTRLRRRVGGRPWTWTAAWEGNGGRIWNGCPIPRGVNLQQISNEIQDTLKWGSMSVIRSAVRHSEAFPEFRSRQRTCVGDQNDGGKALSYDVPQT